MTRNLRLSLLFLLPMLALSLPAVRGQGSDGFRLNASFDRPGLPVPKWRMQILQTGQVQYSADHAAGVHALGESTVQFRLTSVSAGRLKQLLDESHGLQPCETKTKNLARMGMKTLEYQAGDQPAAQCTFNYTDNKPLAAATEMLLAISNTIEQGAALEWQHRYDRLGLDATMTQLVTAAKDGRAIEMQAIRPTLQSLVGDDMVLDRVRQKAVALLATVDTTPAPTATASR